MKKPVNKHLFNTVVLALFIASGFIVYFPGLKAKPVLDDVHTLVQNQGIRTISVKRFFSDPSAFSSKAGNWPYRPIVVLSYALDWKLGNGNLSMFHITNILLHSLTGFFIYLVCGALFDKFRTGIIAGLLFVVHPLTGFSACYPSARSGILCGLFLLVSLLCFVKWEGAKIERGKKLLYGASLLFFQLALLSKIDALSFVFVILGFLFFSEKKLKDKIISGLPFLVLALAFALFFRHISGSLTGAIQSSMLPYYSRSQSVIAGICSPLIYLFKLVWPSHLTIFPAMPEPTWLILSLSLCGYLLVLFLALRNRKLEYWLVLVWYFAALLPASLMRLNILISWHRSYIAMIGIFIGAGLLADFLVQKSNKTGMVFVVIAGLLLAGVSNYQSRAWQDPATLWRMAVERAPKEFAPHHFLGTTFLEKGDLVSAEKELLLAIDLRPDFVDAHNSLGAVYYKTGDLVAAEKEFSWVWESDPENFVYLKNLVIAKLKLSELNGLESLLKKLQMTAPPEDPDVPGIIRDYERKKQGPVTENNRPEK